MTKILSCCMLFCTLFCLTTACSDDDPISGMAGDEGEVVFQFLKNNTFDINRMEDIASIKLTVEKEGQSTVLPSLSLTGEKDSLASEPLRLKCGTYKILSYKAFAADASLLAEVELLEDNLLTVEPGKQSVFYFPVGIKVIYVNNAIKNVLLGICHEVFGDDKTRWPWDEDKDLQDWPNLEFEVDDNGTVLYLATIIFDRKFAPMKKLPEGLSALATLEGLTISDIDLEELPEDLSLTNITSLTLLNTKLKAFPRNFCNTGLTQLTVVNSNLTEIPAEIGNMKELQHLELSGNQLTTLPEGIGKLSKLLNLRVTDAQLVALPDVFEGMYKISHIDFSRNPSLSVLPASIARIRDLRGLVLDGCAFSSVPESVKQCQLIRNISMKGNKLTTITADAFSGNVKIESIVLDDNKLSSFPALVSPTLLELRLNNCGLTAWPDVSSLSNLRWLEFGGNLLTGLPARCFAGNPELRIFSLLNSINLASLPDDLGIALDENNKPAALAFVDVSKCPVLHWTVPVSWCCMEVQPKDDFLEHDPAYTGGDVVIRRVNVKREGSAGVIRPACPDCGSTK